MRNTTWLIDNATHMFRQQEISVEQFFDIVPLCGPITPNPQTITIQVIKECCLVTNVIEYGLSGDTEAHSYIARSYELSLHEFNTTFHVLWDLYTDVLSIHNCDMYLKDKHTCFVGIDNFKSILFQIAESWYESLKMPKSYPYRRDMHRYWKLLSLDDSTLEEAYLPLTKANLKAKLNKNVSQETLDIVVDYMPHVWRNMPKLISNDVAELKTFKQLIDLGASTARHTWYNATSKSYRSAHQKSKHVQFTCMNAPWNDVVELCR